MVAPTDNYKDIGETVPLPRSQTIVEELRTLEGSVESLRPVPWESAQLAVKSTVESRRYHPKIERNDILLRYQSDDGGEDQHVLRAEKDHEGNFRVYVPGSHSEDGVKLGEEESAELSSAIERSLQQAERRKII